MNKGTHGQCVFPQRLRESLIFSFFVTKKEVEEDAWRLLFEFAARSAIIDAKIQDYGKIHCDEFESGRKL